MLSVLPPELTDLVIDFLHVDDRSLRACALTCRAWLSRARYHLWNTVSLDYMSETSPDLAFFLNMVQHSSVGAFIRQLEIRHLDAGTVSTILLKARKLSNLTLLRVDTRCLLRAMNHDVISTSLTTLLLCRLEFGSVSAWTRFFHAFPNLSDLTVMDCLEVLLYDAIPSASSILRLDRLDLDLYTIGRGFIVSWLNNAFSDVQVKRLRLIRMHENHKSSGLWTKIIANVEHLEIDSSYFTDPYPDIATATRIQTIVVEAAELDLFIVLLQVKPRHPLCALTVVLQRDSSRFLDSITLSRIWKVSSDELPPDLGHVLLKPHSGILTVRLEYPLQWDDKLVEALNGLKQVVALQLEEITREGVILHLPN